ncbi:hypothetical protein WH221_15030 [Chryseobacterium culicis]|uniref:DUF7079 domain-containing protein n=1 Tax=Chryseobacterium culicis TaxID=680127 RepID=A0A2S9CSC9_CHRCI|nr:hypothetical protein [Chryseobacterium culicis]PRB83413.1 hypothetical protein CQ022_14990 [Chryseobacterium culicis]PRB89655.1 hypothetical protein CQ033_13885 [Chryseobacterium culicis]
MNEPEFFEERKLVWLALSDLYLDTELQEWQFQYITGIFLKSPFNLEMIKKIDQYEVFPVLFSNLLNPAGEWAGFEEKRLVKNIMTWMEFRSKLDILAIKCIYPIYESVNRDYWKRLEEIYNQTRL